MNSICKKIQDTLATDGPQALRRDDAAQQHLAECNECFAFLESLSAIENGLQGMPGLDAPDHVVESLLARPELAQAAGDPVVAQPIGWRGASGRFASAIAGLLRPRPLVWSSVATGLLLFAFVIGGRFNAPDTPTEKFAVVQYREDSEEQAEPESSAKQREMLKGLGSVGNAKGDDVRGERLRDEIRSLKPNADPSVQDGRTAELSKTASLARSLSVTPRDFAASEPILNPRAKSNARTTKPRAMPSPL